MDASASPPEERPESAPGRPASRRLPRLRKRRDFLAAAKARKANTPGFVLQARRRAPHEPSETEGARMGFTASKKVGNAVARNRAKRRLRALADRVGAEHALTGWDYVLIARAGETAGRDFALMERELAEAFDRAHKAPEGGGGRRPRKRRPEQGGRAEESART